MRNILFFLCSLLILSSCGKKYATHNAVDLPDLVPYKDGERWGFADSTGDVQIKARYDSVSFFHYGIAKVYLNKDGWKRIGFINTEGEEIIPVEYDDIRWLHWEQDYPYLPVQKGEHFGVVSRKGRKIVPCNYHEVDFNSSGYFLVALKRDKITNFGVYDSTGKIIFEPVYRYINPGEDEKRSLYAVAFNEKFGLFDQRGNPLTGFDYEALHVLSPKLVAYGIGMNQFTAPKFGLMSNKGVKLTEALYSHAAVLNDTSVMLIKLAASNTSVVLHIVNEKGKVLHEGDYFRAEKKGTERISLSRMNAYGDVEYGLSDLSGRTIIPIRYHQFSWLGNGNIIVKRDTTAALLDSNGREVIPHNYAGVYAMTERYYSVVSHAGKMGVFNKNGKLILKPEFDEIHVFRDSILKSKKGKNYFYFYPDGTAISARKLMESYYDSVATYDMGNGVTFWEELDCGRYVVSKEDRFYLTNTEGKLDKKNDFDSIRYFKGGLAIYVEKDKFGILDSLGNVLTEPVYDGIQTQLNGTSIVYGHNEKKKGNYYGLVNYKGKEITELEYDRIDAAENGLFRVYRDKKFLGFINYKGEKYFKD